MVPGLPPVDFQALREQVSRRHWVPRPEDSLNLINLAEYAYGSARRMIEYATFLEGLIRDLREEKGLPQTPGEEHWQPFVASLGLRMRRGLYRNRIDGFERLCALTADEILGWKNVGPTSLKILQDALAAKGLSLRR